MYCVECGKKNDENTVYCEHCGKKLSRRGRGGEQQLKLSEYIAFDEWKTWIGVRKKWYGLLLLQLIFCGLFIFAFFYIGERLHGPVSAAEAYFEAASSGEWDKVYESLELPDSIFLTENQFLKVKAEEEQGEYDSWQFSQKARNEETASVLVTYAEGEQEHEEEIHLVKQEEKAFFFFDTWKIDGHDMLSEEVHFLLPDEAEVTLDEIVLDEEYIEGEDGSYIDYVIPFLFSGKHLLEMEAEHKEDFQEVVLIPDSEGYQYYGEPLAFRTEYEQEILEEAAGDLQKIYQAGMNRESFKKVTHLFDSDAVIQQKAQKAYESFAKKLCDEDGFGIKDVKFSDIKAEIGRETGEEELVVVTLSCQASFKRAVKDEDGQIEEKEEDQTYETRFLYDGSEGHWVIKEFGFDGLEEKKEG